MVLYRTDDYNSDERTTDLREILLYEIFYRENDELFTNLCKLSSYASRTSELITTMLNYRNNSSQSQIVLLIEDLLSDIEEKIGHKLSVGLWLYPLENVQEYYSFQGYDPVIFGYNVSDILLIAYSGEGALYAYETMPLVVDKE